MPSVNIKKNGQWVGQPVLGFKIGEDNLTDELKGKINNNSNVEFDDSLTQSGKAADAKTVGDALAEKAPGGFGLGTTVPHAPNDNINELDISKTGYFTGLVDSPYPNAWYIGYNIAYGNGYAYQVVWVLNYLGIMAQRFIDAGTIGEWEYHNPPMIPNKIYRTTKRYNGKPVYVQLNSFGALPNNTLKTASIGVSSNTYRLVDFKYNLISSDKYVRAFPTNTLDIYFAGDTGTYVMYAQTTGDLSHYSAEVITEFVQW